MASELKKAAIKDAALLADIRAAIPDQNSFNLWWLGQSGFLIHYAGEYLLFDPYLSDSLTRKYQDTDKPHTRISECVIDPATLDMVSIVTSSHNHTDHLDAETLIPLSKANPRLQLILPEVNIAFAKERLAGAAIDYLGIDEHTMLQQPPWTIHGITAAHNEVVRNDIGQSSYLGFVVEFGGFTIYHSGDTIWHDTLVPELREFKIDVALVPINGNRPERRVAGNLNAAEAACLAKAVGAKLAIPHHYDLFEFNTADPQEFVKACESVRQPFQVLQLGERLNFSRASLSGN